jgi:hypothetical protein
LTEQHDARGQWSEQYARPDQAAVQSRAVSSLVVPVRHGR